MLSKEAISNLFLRFSEKECKGSSDLYEFLAIKIAKDDDLLNICLNTKNNQPVPNLFFGAVHYLLLKGQEHKLREYYPSIVAEAKPYNESFEYFKEFCLIYKNEIISILQTKLVQTNEVRRCAYLYPVFNLIFEKAKKPLALIEIGTSAGLQLLWDKYSYSYNIDEIVGDKSSKLLITSEIIGDKTPFLSQTPAPISTRIGIDLNPIDLNNDEEYLWLKSLIWPEHKERLEMFENVASYMKSNSIDLIKGDGVTLLSKIAENIPLDGTICIFHTYVANQMPQEAKRLLLQTVESIGQGRDVFHIYNNIQDRNLHLDYYLNGIQHEQTIAETDGHGRWFRWLMDSRIL